MLTYYFDRRDRRRERREERSEAERTRREEREAAEQARREEREAAEQARREEREAAERRHQEMMTALTGTIAAILERNGHSASTDQSAVIAELQRRVTELETENARLRNGDATSDEV